MTTDVTDIRFPCIFALAESAIAFSRSNGKSNGVDPLVSRLLLSVLDSQSQLESDHREWIDFRSGDNFKFILDKRTSISE